MRRSDPRLTGAILALIATSSVALMLSGHAHAQIVQRTIAPLGPADVAKSARQREQVAALARRHVGQPITGRSRADLGVLQRLLDDRHVERKDAYGQQCLGLALGDVMERTLGREWVVVDDERGHSRALRLRGQDELFFPITMISKRVAFKQVVDVRALYDQVAQRVAVLRKRS